jgi:hypothetical protein
MSIDDQPNPFELIAGPPPPATTLGGQLARAHHRLQALLGAVTNAYVAPPADLPERDRLQALGLEHQRTEVYLFHAGVRDEPQERACRICGCTEEDACTTPRPCSWVAENLCSACALQGGGMRRFVLQRETDVSGVSGTGVVADGVMWPDGSASVHWRGERPSIVFWPWMQWVEEIHGHGGSTHIVWLDQAGQETARA